MCGWLILAWGLSCGCHQMVIETGTVEERLEQPESGQGTLSLHCLRASPCGSSAWATLRFLTAWWTQGSQTTCMVAQCSSVVFHLTR